MDSAAITLTVAQIIPYLQQYGPLLATKAVEALGEKVPGAVGALWGSIKARFDAEGAARTALEKLLSNPQDEKLKTVVEYHLEEYLKNDPAFAEKIAALLKEAQAAAPAGTSYQATASGGSAIAQGRGANAVTGGSTLIQGGVQGDVITGGGEKSEQSKKSK